MFLKIRFLTKVINSNIITYYFIHKDLNILLPIQITENSSTLTNTYINTLDMLNILIKSITIGDDFYTNINLNCKDKNYDMDIKLEDSLNILDRYYDPLDILIDKDILFKEGITITKELIESYL